MFREKTLHFQGSKDRLHRMVARHGGTFLGNQRFALQWQPSRYKKLHRLTFGIRCRYAKEEIGYRIAYRIRPTWFSALRMGIPPFFWLWGMTCLWDPAEPAGGIAATLLAGSCILSDVWQMRDSEKEFLRCYTAVTK